MVTLGLADVSPRETLQTKIVMERTKTVDKFPMKYRSKTGKRMTVGGDFSEEVQMKSENNDDSPLNDMFKRPNNFTV